MVDFKKLLGKEKLAKTIDPLPIFNNLDKESGKEYLRPPQEAVLKEWHLKFRGQRDVIVKLHTGQGKTLIGLLILQSSIAEGLGPAVYLCPNNFLVEQTIKEANSFGINTVQFESTNPPRAFLNSDAVLVTNCKKLFNGKSVFGVAGSGHQVISLGCIVVDDAHRCLDIIREAFSIRIKRKFDGKPHPLYKALWELFEDSLRRQAAGTCSDIRNGIDCLQAVPFWTWHDKQKDVIKILGENKDLDPEVKFSWDLIKNNLSQSVCVFSGKGWEISPRLIPLELIPSFWEARRRVFLSATLTEDAFLVRDLGIEKESVSNPLSTGDESYSGERLIILPTLVDLSLNREVVIDWVSRLSKKHGTFGVVGITPSFVRAERWANSGASVTNVDNLNEGLQELKHNISRKNAKQVLVLVNEYDGVDLPDSMCRILCLDSLPSYNSLIDRYMQEIRPSAGRVRRLMAQRVEQGMGRGIRGSSDWCVVVITGDDITNFLSEYSKRQFLSKEAQMQIRIAEELTKAMQREGPGLSAIESLVDQCLERDMGWKEYYKKRMAELDTEISVKQQLEREVFEREAEILYRQGHYQQAANALEKLANMTTDSADKGWYLQLIAAYLYPLDSGRSMDIQLRAHTENYNVFLPEAGVSYSKLQSVGLGQSRQIELWIKEHESYNSLILDLTRILDAAVFSSPSDSFEEGMDGLGRTLGLSSQRPEKATGQGPDNLWQLGEKNYWVIECKNRVGGGRKEISKSEVGQLNNDMGWFAVNYEGCSANYVLIHPNHLLAKDAFPNATVWILNEEHLNELKETVKKFYNSVKNVPITSLTSDLIKQRLAENHVLADNLPRYLKRAERQGKKR